VRSGKHHDDTRISTSAGLVAAAFLNKLDELNELLRADVDVNSDLYDVSALSEASARGSLEAATVLVQYGAELGHDINQYGRTALRIAAENAHLNVVKFSLGQGASPFIEQMSLGPVPMFVEDSEVLGVLLNTMHQSIEGPSAGALSDSAQTIFRTAFHVFVAFGYDDGLRTLMNLDASLPSNVLQTAVSFGQTDTLELLIANGALTTYDRNKECCFYGLGSGAPDRAVVQDSQNRLDQSIAGKQEWEQLSGSS
jgi:ankyrin repeat protein